MIIYCLYVLFGEESIKIFHPFCKWIVFLLLSFQYFFYVCILAICSLSDTCFPNIFSHSAAVILLTVSITEQKFLILIKSNSLFFSLMDHTFDIVFINALPNLRSPRFSPTLLLAKTKTEQVKKAIHLETWVISFRK